MSDDKKLLGYSIVSDEDLNTMPELEGESMKIEFGEYPKKIVKSIGGMESLLKYNRGGDNAQSTQ